MLLDVDVCLTLHFSYYTRAIELDKQNHILYRLCPKFFVAHTRT